MENINFITINTLIAIIVIYTGIPISCNGYKYSKSDSAILRFEYMYDDTTKFVTENKKVGLFSFDSIYNLKIYNNSGKLKSEIQAMNDIPHGESKDYYSNGNIESCGLYSEGKMVGIWKEYYENGYLKDSCIYDNNRILAGTDFYNNGKIKNIYKYEHGKFHGMIQQYDSLHTTKILSYWSSGEKDSTIYYKLPEIKRIKKTIKNN